MINKFSALSFSVALGLLVSCGDSDSDDKNEGITVTLGEPSQKTFAASATGHDRFFAVAFDSQGNYYAAGSVADSTDTNADYKMLVAKFKADGELDTTFGTDGYAIHNAAVRKSSEVARGVLVQPSGKIVIAGTIDQAVATDARDRDIGVLRLDADGNLDSTFGTNGLVTLNLGEGRPEGDNIVADTFGGLIADSSGRLVIHASRSRADKGSDFVLARLSADGLPDDSFGTNGQSILELPNQSASPKTLLLLPSGQIVGTGYIRNPSNIVVPVLYRTDANGELDKTFGTEGIYSEAVLAHTTEVYSAVLQGDSIVTVGYGRNSDTEHQDFLSLRVKSDGTRDTAYGSNGYVRIDASGFDDNGRNMTALPDGRLVLVGGGRTSKTTADGMIAILNPDGQADTSFTETGSKLFDFGGTADFLWGAAVSPAGDKAVIVGLKAGVTDGNDDAAIVTIPLQ